jgi:glycine cleavage system P protein (glycine dehydrogenase) subunit 1
MPFIPHTEEDVRAMLASIGVDSIEQLFDEIPPELRQIKLQLAEGLSEMEVMRLMQQRAQADGEYSSFLGAGAYEHHIPAAVWQIATRGEFYSAYTPYQAEASQGTLQLLFEYQTMMASLTGMDVTNASLYDGASALAEAVLMAVRLQRGPRRVLVPATLSPTYRAVVRAIVSNQDIELVELPYAPETGTTELDSLRRWETQPFAALVIPHPNFFGALEPVHKLTDWAHAQNALAIGVINPVSVALLQPPGAWGEKGCDIALGEGQPLGVPLAGGGPYFGFIACKQAHVRQMPGRIVGQTLDAEGRIGFALTLQAREQHIRRSKATSNICTNQGLAVTAATIYMAILGPEGLRNVARACHANLLALLERVTTVPGVRRRFATPVFHEAVLNVSVSAHDLLERLQEQRLLAGFDLSRDYPELGNALLVCVTETKTQADIEGYANALQSTLGQLQRAAAA